MGRYALLVGISSYTTGLNPLPSAVRDVAALREVLINPEIGGFGESEVEVLTDVDETAMRRAISRLFANRKSDDLLLFYFSGHGVTDRLNDFYLTGISTDKDDLLSTAVSADYVHKVMNQRGSKRQVIILDCCHSGAFPKGLTAKNIGTVKVLPKLGGEGRAILTASDSTQYAFEQEGFELSLYTHFLVEGLKTGVADQDEDGQVSIDELHDYVRDKVRSVNNLMSPEFYPVKGGYRIILAKAVQDNSLKFRKEVEELAKESSGEISIFARNHLELRQQELGIDQLEAETTINEVLHPYQEYAKKLVAYEQSLQQAAHQFPFSQIVQAHLQKYETSLGLRPEDLQAIKNCILAPKQAEYERQLQHQAAQRQEAAQRLKQQQKAAERQRQAAEAERLRGQQADLQDSEVDLDLYREDIKATNNRLRLNTLITLPDLTIFLSRRNFLILGLTGSGLGGALFLSNIKPPDSQQPNAPKIPSTSKSFTFNVVKVDGTGKEIERKQVDSLIYDFGNGITLDMVNIPAGKFMMGSNESASEQLIHEVTIKEGFWMGKYTVTNALWKAVIGTEPLKQYSDVFQGDNQPVVGVSWHECNKFCKELSAQTGKEFRLPSEAEWEYACRAGTQTRYHFGDDENQLGSYAWYVNNSNGQTYPVGEKNPNQFGLYDMHGNVWEWCLDEWHVDYNSKPESLKANGNEPWGEINVNDNDNRSCLLRGGSWIVDARNCRSSYRFFNVARIQYHNYGFRVVCHRP